MKFSIEEYKRAVKDYENTWKVTDEILYGLCLRNPGHVKQAGVNAKLWIIGRTYATRIESKIPTNNQQGGSMTKLATLLFENSKKADSLINLLPRLAAPLNPENLRTIMDVHGQFMALIQEVLREGQSPRSFVSKYLHFHSPLVPIIDSYAERACRKFVRWQDSLQLFDLPPCADEQYAWYLFRFWEIYRQAQAAGLKPNVKHLDHYLLSAVEK